MTLWKIPPRFHYAGDKRKGRSFISFARRRLQLLKTDMDFTGRKTGRNAIRLSSGEMITTSINHGIVDINIFVPLPRRVLPISKLRKVDSLIYFYKITHNGTVPEYATFEELKTSRIIIWETEFKDGDFIPGEGKVILDADLYIDEVYTPANLSPDKKAESLALALKYWDLPDEDLAQDWFETGETSNPMYAYWICAYNLNSFDAQTLSFDTPFVGGSGENWWHMMERFDHYEDDRELWKDLICPLEGGTPDNGYTSQVWPSLVSSSSYYADMEYPAYAPNVSPQLVCNSWTDENSYYIEVRSFSPCDRLGQDNDYVTLDGLKLGRYFTGTTDYSFPCFFSHIRGLQSYTLTNELYLIGTKAAHDDEYIDTNITIENEDVFVSMNQNIETPLEQVSYLEFAISDGSAGTCSETNCFQLAPNVSIWSEISSAYLLPELNEYAPCDLANAEGTGIHMFIDKEVNTHDSDFITEVHAGQYTLQQEDGSKEIKNIFCLRTQVDHELSGRGATSWFKTGDTGDWICNEVTYINTAFSSLPISFQSVTGVIIYIMNPESFYTETIDPETEEIIRSDYWDIHSARGNPELINQYRCLDLEEYINGVLVDYKAKVKDIVGIPVTADGAQYTLKTYGHLFFDGFLSKI